MKVSNSRNDLQDHPGTLIMILVPFDSPYDFLLVFHRVLHSLGDIVTYYCQNLKRSYYDPEHTPFGGNLSRIPGMLVLVTVNLNTKFEIPNFTHFRDMTVQSLKVGHLLDPDHDDFGGNLSCLDWHLPGSIR